MEPRRGRLATLALAVAATQTAVGGQDSGQLNRLIDRLESGRPAIGTFARTPGAELDFVVIDTQYGTFDLDAVRETVAAFGRQDSGPVTPPIVRIPRDARHDPDHVVSQLLDLGVFGVMFPDIETREEAAAAVGAMRYRDSSAGVTTSRGQRAPSVGTAPAYWSMTEPDYRARADLWPLEPDGELVALLQIESAAGVENVDEILKVPGVGAIFLGPFDLADSLGESGPTAPRIEALVQDVLAACVAKNVPCGYPIVAQTRTAAEEETARRLSEGFRILAVMVSGRE